MSNPLKMEPVRLFAIATAALALVAFYVPTLPVPLIVALIGAILGVGEVARSKVVPTAKLEVSDDLLEDLLNSPRR